MAGQRCCVAINRRLRVRGVLNTIFGFYQFRSIPHTDALPSLQICPFKAGLAKDIALYVLKNFAKEFNDIENKESCLFDSIYHGPFEEDSFVETAH